MSNNKTEHAPTGEVHDNSYTTGGNEKVAPVVSDNAGVEDPYHGTNPDSNAQLERDEDEAIDKGNILGGDRTRHAAKPAETYREPGDTEGLEQTEDRGRSGAASTTGQVLRS